MTTSATGGKSGEASRYDIAGLIADLGDVPVTTDSITVRRRSRDYFWYSPVLNAKLHGLAADVVVVPRNEADVVKVAAACARRRVPITPRGLSTGNYGQAVPLQGGVLLDMSGMAKVLWQKPGVVRVEAGMRIDHLDAALVPNGWELRMHPSTKRMATIGGFVSGGSGGVGSIGYGGLREPGNVIAARVVTLEETPRVIDLRGDETQKINRTFGTTGIVTELEMPLAPALPWIDVVVTFDDFFKAVEVGHELALADGIVKKLVSAIKWPLPSHFGPLREFCPDGKSMLALMIAEPSMESFRSLLKGRGQITMAVPMDESAAKIPLYEYTWNHTTLQVLKTDRGVTYLQCLYPHDRLQDTVRKVTNLLGDESIPHLEFIRFGGKVSCSALPVVRYTTEARLNQLIDIYEENGVTIANPHVFTVEDGSRHKRTDADQLGFKREVDPYGLCNPGKMRTYVPVRA